MAAVTDTGACVKNGEPDLTVAERQTTDPQLQMLRAYLENQTLLQDEEHAQHVLLSHGQYALVDDILHHVEPCPCMSSSCHGL